MHLILTEFFVKCCADTTRIALTLEKLWAYGLSWVIWGCVEIHVCEWTSLLRCHSVSWSAGYSKLIAHWEQLTWWRHQMVTFSALLTICAGNSPVPGEFPTQRPVTRSFDVYFHLRPDKRLSKQSWGWWFETVSHSLWRHRNECLGLPCVVHVWQLM